MMSAKHHEMLLNDFGFTWILVEGLEKSFDIASTPVTCDQYARFCEANGYEMPEAPYGRSKIPVMGVDVVDVESYCEWLSKETGTVVRMSSQHEWLFAARGGNKSKRYKYSGGNNFSDVGWHSPHDVGTKPANELGIYDKSGNVWEWCGRGSDAENEFMLLMDLMPVLGGRGTLHGEPECSCCNEIPYRIWSGPYERASGFGFRVVRE